jgi:hypothetical protein
MSESKNQQVKNRDVNAAVRASLAVKLRASKVGYEQIAKQCGYGSAGAAHNAIQRELKRNIVANVEEMRREELASLETLELECWKRLTDKEFTKPMLFAVDRIVAIKERRAKLMGLDVKPDAIPDGLTIIRKYAAEVDQV